jgi:uncharacterized protein
MPMMNEPSGLVEDLSGFSGVAPLFPLPDFVLFPQVTQPLHIFEPRYRQMMADVLKGDRLIALGTLKPNWDQLYETKTAPVFSDVCLGRVMLDREMDDGKYIIIIRGLCRARIRAEKLTTTPYRQVELDLRFDKYSNSPEIERSSRRAELLEALVATLPDIEKSRETTEAALRDLPLGVLADLIASSLKIPTETLISLLTENHVDLRTDLLLDLLRAEKRSQHERAASRKFPPDFSAN